MRKLTKVFLLPALLASLAGTALAEWPYLTEEASTLAQGRFSVTAGVSRTAQRSSDLPGGRGVLWTLPEVEGTLGLGPFAEVSFSYAALYFEAHEDSATHYESGDLRVWTKLRLYSSPLQSAGLRFGTKLPNASEANGLGTNNTDFFASALWDLHLGPALLSLNAGLGILGSTERNQSQDDVLTWGGAVQLPLGKGFSAGLDASGYAGPFGNRTKHKFAWLGPVVSWRSGGLRFDLAGRRGISDALGWGIVAGVSYDR